jgi:hypothetical protein
MKILYSKSTVPTWAKILMFLIFNLLCLIFFALNLYFGIAMLIFINWLTYEGLKNAGILDKWKKTTLEKDPFFQQNNFSLASYSQFSLLAVSSSIVRIVNIKSTIQVHRSTYNISEVYKNYPRQGVDIILNGLNVYHFDIPIENIKSAETILVGDAGGFGVLNSLNFGVRITTINEEIYDVDTPFSKEFRDEVNKNLTNSFVEDSPIIMDTPTIDDRKRSENENIKNLTKADDTANRKQSKKIVKLIVKIIIYVILIPAVSIFFLVVMNEFSKNVHWITATGISVVGILFFFLSKRLKKKEDLFITEKFGAITLSSPLYIDLFSILSIVFIITGIFLNYDIVNTILYAKDESLAVNKNFLLPKIVVGAIALFFYYLAYRRLRYSMFDKIVISQEEICIDDPRSNDLIQLSKKDIIKIVEVVVRNSKKNEIKSKKIVIYAFKEEVETTYDLDESYLSEMSISYNLFVNSLKKVGYVITN